MNMVTKATVPLTNMDKSLTQEDIDRIYAHVAPINRVDALRRVRWLLERAEVGNWYYHELEDRWGFVGDYIPEDAGMHWSDNGNHQ